MFCTNCGTKLPDGSKFCNNCGVPQAEILPPAAPVVPVEVPAPEAPIQQKPAPAAPVQQEPAPETAVFQEPAASAQQMPVYTAPTFDLPNYADVPVPPELKPKKKSKAGAIFSIILILILLAGAAAGVIVYLNAKNTAYNTATALLNDGKINEALAAFEEVGRFKDAPEITANLKAYQHATLLMSGHKYNEAIQAFEKLGDFHDSKTYAQSGVTYHKGKYLMECGKNADTAALPLIVDDPEAFGDDGNALSLALYSEAARVFEGLGDYLDSADLASECWYNAGLMEIQCGHVENALGYKDKLNEEDAAALQAAVEANAADATILADLDLALVVWLDETNAYSTGDAARLTYEHLAGYQDAYFVDTQLKNLYVSFMESLQTQVNATNEAGDVTDWVMYYTGSAAMHQVIDQLNAGYGFLENSQRKEIFVGRYETLAKYPEIEKAVAAQFTGVTALWHNDGYYYVPFTNNTGCNLTLHVTVDFYKGNTFLESGDTKDITIAAGETAEVPIVPKSVAQDGWDSWLARWTFDVT